MSFSLSTFASSDPLEFSAAVNQPPASIPQRPGNPQRSSVVEQPRILHLPPFPSPCPSLLLLTVRTLHITVPQLYMPMLPYDVSWCQWVWLMVQPRRHSCVSLPRRQLSYTRLAALRIFFDSIHPSLLMKNVKSFIVKVGVGAMGM